MDFFPERLYTSITEALHQDSSAHGGAAGNYSSRFQELISPGAPASAAGSPEFGQRRRHVAAGRGARLASLAAKMTTFRPKFAAILSET